MATHQPHNVTRPSSECARNSWGPLNLTTLHQFSPEYVIFRDSRPEFIEELLSHYDRSVARITAGHLFDLITSKTFLDYSAFQHATLDAQAKVRSNCPTNNSKAYSTGSDVFSLRQVRCFEFGGHKDAVETEHSIVFAKNIQSPDSFVVALTSGEAVASEEICCKVFLPSTNDVGHRWHSLRGLFRAVEAMSNSQRDVSQLCDPRELERAFFQSLPDATTESLYDLSHVQLTPNIMIGVRSHIEVRIPSFHLPRPLVAGLPQGGTILFPELYECLRATFREQRLLLRQLGLENNSHETYWPLFQAAQAFTLLEGDVRNHQLNSMSNSVRSQVRVEFTRSFELCDALRLRHDCGRSSDDSALPLPDELAVTSDVTISSFESDLGPVSIGYRSHPCLSFAVKVPTTEARWADEFEQDDDPQEPDVSFEDWQPEQESEKDASQEGVYYDREEWSPEHDISDESDLQGNEVAFDRHGHSFEVAFFSPPPDVDGDLAERRWEFIDDASFNLGEPVDMTVLTENVDVLDAEAKHEGQDVGFEFSHGRIRITAHTRPNRRRLP